MKYLLYFAQSMILLMLTPLFMGIIKSLKASIRGYMAPPIMQPYYDIKKLLSKGRVVSISSSFITGIAPVLCLSACITAVFMIPVFFNGGNSYYGNLFVIVFLLGVVKFFMSLTGLDTASAFGGMGSSRELFISMLVEPVMFIIVAFLYMETKSLNIFTITSSVAAIPEYNVANMIAAMGFAVLIVAENARMPVDNPETHLELTMIHEAMILDTSGKDLALMELASYVKLMAFITIFINCFFPMGMASSLEFLPIMMSFIYYVLKLLVVLGLIALIECFMAKFRLFRIPELLSAAFSLSLVAMVIKFF
ncbi:MAG: respiratory chain complex I subunit 1 family protein [Clostridiaceae bacterium]